MGISGYEWSLGVTNDVTTEKFLTWTNIDALDGSGDMHLGPDRRSDFVK